MSVRIIDKTPEVDFQAQQKCNIFLRTMADHIVSISTPKTPKKTGRLRMDVVKSVLGLKGKIKWGKNYASRQEETQFVNYTTPGTGPHYAKNAVNQAVGDTQLIAKRAGLG